MVVMAPGDEKDVAPMLHFALTHSSPTSLRYPKTNTELVDRPESAIELGQAEIYEWGTDGTILAFGTLFSTAVRAAERLRQQGLDVGVVNARFAKPIDSEVVARAIRETGFVITLEESTLTGGFGSAVLEAANSMGLPTDGIRCLGIPDHFVEHGGRDELLADLGLDVDGLVSTARKLAANSRVVEHQE